MNLKRVFEPITIRNAEIKNRIVRTAHGTYLSTTPHIGGGEDILAYHLARAKGGVGLSLFEAGEVHETAVHGGSVRTDDVIKDYQRIMKAVRPYGMRMLQQLWHGGHHYTGINGSPAWGVSDLPGVFGFVPKQMTIENIQTLIAAYAKAAWRCREGGLDGVEFHAAHGYLPHQFLSPMINTRTDQYGGSLENRMRFSQEALRAIRQAVGADFIVGIRMSASQSPGSVTEAELRKVIEKLEAEGLIDYLNASQGDYYRLDTLIGGIQQPTGYGLPSSSQLTAVSRVPRIVSGRFRTLEDAEQALSEGVADMVSMVRAHIADPDLVRKTIEGRVSEIRPCIACNQGCQGGIWRNRRLGCAVNAAAGFEATLAEDLITRTEAPRHVLVVGGGPAGMEAARIAALRGHKVTLAEAAPVLGGAMNVAKRVPRAHGLGDILQWLESEIYRLGVAVRLNTYLEPEDVREIGADAVILATGSAPRMDGVQLARPGVPVRGIALPHVVSSVDLIMGVHKPGRTALVLDTIGHFEASGVAEFLVDQGVAVTYVTHHGTFGGNYIQTTLRDVPILERLYQGDFELLTRHLLVDIERGSCRVRPLDSSKLREVPAETVVLVTPNRSISMFDALSANNNNLDIRVVGDALAARDLQAAIGDGHRAAREIA